jgi:hypothetical protein
MPLLTHTLTVLVVLLVRAVLASPTVDSAVIVVALVILGVLIFLVITGGRGTKGLEHIAF